MYMFKNKIVTKYVYTDYYILLHMKDKEFLGVYIGLKPNVDKRYSLAKNHQKK